jgi:hypothetical protein
VAADVRAMNNAAIVAERAGHPLDWLLNVTPARHVPEGERVKLFSNVRGRVAGVMGRNRKDTPSVAVWVREKKRVDPRQAGEHAHAAIWLPIAAGQAASNAVLYHSTNGVAAGAMSAAYGGSGGALTYSAEADFKFTTMAPEEFYLTLLDNNHAGVGFDSLELKIDVNGTDYLTLDTDSLNFAEGFFANNRLDLGTLGAGSQSVDISYMLTASLLGAGFGFSYDTSVPEPSTWAMMLLGIAGLGFAGFRRARAV